MSSMSDFESVSSASDEGGVGLASAESSGRRRVLLDLINRLHSTGAQVDIDLPQIAVIGSQSAGKSSLIESISGITLPRAAGTCTRCPTECRLSNAENDWKCVVSLRFTKDSDGQLLGVARNEQFGGIIFEKDEVEERIRRAQRAILNPSRSPSDFLKGDDEDFIDNQLSFSANCVSLQISGPGVADLSFCDLPGLIASTGSGGNEGDINLVKSLVGSYIVKPSCLILLTVACETDFENQGAHNLAKTHDPHGERTIGVLTKPDRIPTGEEDGWVSFIRGEKEALENNWYCVKQPSSTDLKKGITWSDARRVENEFFSTVSPWCSLDSIYQKYLRTSNLVARLSHILSELIAKRLPDIRLEMERAIEKTLNQLNTLPAPPSGHPMQEVSALLSEFTKAVSTQVIGIPDVQGVIQTVRRSQDEFRAKVLRTAPNFRPYSQSKAGEVSWKKPPFINHEDKYEESDVNIIYIDDVYKRALNARTRELPGNYPFVVTSQYIDKSTAQWKTPAQMLCKEVFGTMSKAMNTLVAEHFSAFGQGQLEQRVRLHIQAHLKRKLEVTEEKIDWLIKLEAQPFTMNNHYLGDYTQKFLRHYKAARHASMHSDVAAKIAVYAEPTLTRAQFQQSYGSKTLSPNHDMQDVLGGLSRLGFSGTTANDLGALFPVDEMDAALKIMADVRAYFQVAYKRFVDNVPLAIDYDLVQGFDRGLLATLCEGLGIHGPKGHEICEELAQESPQVADRREELGKKLERLQTAYQELMQAA